MEFSKFLNKYKKNKKELFSPAIDLINLCEEIKNDDNLSIYYEELKVKIYDKNTQKSDFDMLIREILKINTVDNDKLKLQEMLLKENDKLKKLINLDIDNNYKDINSYKESMQVIKEEKYILESVCTNLNFILEAEKIKKIDNIFKTHYKKLEELLKEIVVFNTQEEILSNEILYYSTTIAKLKQKYKLSLDWNGNKKQMIIRGNQLKSERQNLVLKETDLNKKCKNIYNYICLLHNSFRNEYTYIIKTIEKEVEKTNKYLDNLNSTDIIKNTLIDYINLYY